MKPVIAITMGDYNGIGPEIVLKSIRSPIVQKICIPMVVGSIDVFEYYARKLKLRVHLKEVESIPDSSSRNILSIVHIRKFQRPVINSGRISDEAGSYAGEAIEIAADLCKQQIVGGMVTAPVSKEVLTCAGLRFPGQTEMLANLSATPDVLMMLVAHKFRVGLATMHIPLRRVAQNITKDLVSLKLEILHRSLLGDFSIKKPKIAVLGLNPHAGENGQIGNEERQYILPAIEYCRKQGIHAEGPFPADGFFGTHGYKNYDAVFAMYHDQGLIPFKMTGFKIGVNFSAGLPLVRTSPDHGTAFNIAGKGCADSSSMIEAIRLAVAIFNNRKRNKR